MRIAKVSALSSQIISNGYRVGSDGNVLNHITYDSFEQVTSETNPTVTLSQFCFGLNGYPLPVLGLL